jgi:hypothetical protein
VIGGGNGFFFFFFFLGLFMNVEKFSLAHSDFLGFICSNEYNYGNNLCENIGHLRIKRKDFDQYQRLKFYLQ